MSNGVLYLITVIIWGSTWLAITFQLGEVPPAVSIAYRFTLAAGILLGYCKIRGLPLKFSPRDHFFMALQGLLLFSLNYILVYLSELYLTSGLVAVIFSMIVIFNVIFSVVLLRKSIDPGVILGAVLGLGGLVLVFWPELRQFGLKDQRAFGAVLAFAGALSASLGNITSARNQRAGLPVVQVNAYGMGYGALLMLGFAVVQGATFTFDFNLPYVGSLLYLAIFGSVVAFGTYLTLLGRIGPERAGYVTVLFPIIALALSTLYEGLAWELRGVVGVALVLLGNSLVLRRPQTGPAN